MCGKKGVNVIYICSKQGIWLEAVFKSAGHEYQIIQNYTEQSDWWTSGQPVSVDDTLPLLPASLAYQRHKFISEIEREERTVFKG